MLAQIFGQVLGHALGERGNQHPLVRLCSNTDLRQQIVHLGANRPDLHRRIGQARRAHDLFDDLRRNTFLVGGGSRRYIDGLRRQVLEFIKSQRPIVQRRGQSEAVFDQRLLAGPITFVHGAELRNRLVAFIDHHQRILGQVIE